MQKCTNVISQNQPQKPSSFLFHFTAIHSSTQSSRDPSMHNTTCHLPEVRAVLVLRETFCTIDLNYSFPAITLPNNDSKNFSVMLGGLQKSDMANVGLGFSKGMGVCIRMTRFLIYFCIIYGRNKRAPVFLLCFTDSVHGSTEQQVLLLESSKAQPWTAVLSPAALSPVLRCNTLSGQGKTFVAEHKSFCWVNSTAGFESSPRQRN